MGLCPTRASRAREPRFKSWNLKTQFTAVEMLANQSGGHQHTTTTSQLTHQFCAISLGGEKTVMCRNNFDWDCSSSAHSFQIDDESLSGHGSLCGFTFSRTNDASSIENLMLFDKVESEVWAVERDVRLLCWRWRKRSGWKTQLCPCRL